MCWSYPFVLFSLLIYLFQHFYIYKRFSLLILCCYFYHFTTGFLTTSFASLGNETISRNSNKSPKLLNAGITFSSLHLCDFYKFVEIKQTKRLPISFRINIFYIYIYYIHIHKYNHMCLSF